MNIDIVRAWKDAAYRDSLSEQELAQLPEHPAGQIELSDDELSTVIGAGGGFTLCQVLSVCVNSVIC
jgi:mersacidin/lichenicidin family type 2 lantibiotic